MTSSQPLPALNDDPDFLRGFALQDAYIAEIQRIRSDVTLSDLGMGEQIDAVWRRACSQIAEAGRSLRERQIARLESLASLIPIGPNIPVDASEADSTVMFSAWRATLAQAQQLAHDRTALMSAYNDAQRFGDDTMMRAVLTVAQDNGITEVVNRWAALNPDLAPNIAELDLLQDVLRGMSTDSLRIRQAFRLPEQPTESSQLPTTRQMAQMSIGGQR